MTESQYQTKIVKKLARMFPNSIILKTDPAYKQGVPDLLILWRSFWAALEIKISPKANIQPNQNYYIRRLGEMSFAAYIYPENEEEILNALQQAFESPR